MPVVLWGGWPSFERAWTSVVNRHLNMFTLIGLGVSVAFVYSLIATIGPIPFPPTFRDAMGHVGEYYEAPAAIVALVLPGQVMARADSETGRPGLGVVRPDRDRGRAHHVRGAGVRRTGTAPGVRDRQCGCGNQHRLPLRLGTRNAEIQPGETHAYEFTLQQTGTLMYHPHFDEMTQIVLGMHGFFIVHPGDASIRRVDRDFVIFLNESSSSPVPRHPIRP